MLVLKNENALGKWITFFYLAFAIIEVIGECFFFKPVLYFFKPLPPLLLIVLYWNKSNQKSPLFIAIILSLLVVDVLFIPGSYSLLVVGAIVFLLHRLLMIYYIGKLIKLKDFIPLIIATLPFGFFFFYLLDITIEFPENTLFLLILQNMLISILGGMILSVVVMNQGYSTWLLIFGLLSVSVYFVVFIEKIYLYKESSIVFRPLAMILNTMVYYTFYRFVIEAESSSYYRRVLE